MKLTRKEKTTSETIDCGKEKFKEKLFKLNISTEEVPTFDLSKRLTAYKTATNIMLIIKRSQKFLLYKRQDSLIFLPKLKFNSFFMFMYLLNLKL